MRWFRKIILSGTTFTELDSEKRNIILSNYLSIICALAAILAISARLIFGDPSLFWVLEVSISTLLFLLPLLLNRLGYVLTSRLVLCYVPSFILIILSILVLKDKNESQTSTFVGIRFYFLSMVCFPFLVFSLKNKKLLLLGLFGAIYPLLLFDPILNFFGAGYFQKGLTEITYYYNNIRAFISVFIIGFSCYFLKRVIEKSQDVNEDLIRKLVEKNAMIAEQNEELNNHQEELKAINQNLEGLVNERTEKIKTKNEQIIKYTFTNSHKVRGPVARILGLIQLSKLENETDYKFLFEKIQQEANEMDVITREINTDLDQHID